MFRRESQRITETWLRVFKLETYMWSFPLQGHRNWSLIVWKLLLNPSAKQTVRKASEYKEYIYIYILSEPPWCQAQSSSATPLWECKNAERTSHKPLHKSALHIQYTYMVKRVKQILYQNITIRNTIWKKLLPPFYFKDYYIYVCEILLSHSSLDS